MKFVAFLCLLVLSCALAATCSAQICLNEILADPASDWNGDGEVDSKTDEWIEIMNTGSSNVDLASFRLSDLSGGYDWRFAFGGTLAPGEMRVVYGSEVVEWQSENGVSTYGLSLNNAGDTVFLYVLSAADTIVMDSYEYVSHEVVDDRSTGRKPDGMGSWAIFDGLNPYGGTKPPLGTGCNPSPGLPTACATPIEAITWGHVKSLFVN
ncbi:MAG: lamin tail domain-containing protein [Candidatus Latescibacterota bacterium]